MLNSEAEKILSDAMMTLGLQDDRVKTIFRLMQAVGYVHQNAHPLPEQSTGSVDIKYMEELDTTRQRLAFREWWEQKTRTAHPMNVAYDMFLEHVKAKNELEIQLDQVINERDHHEAWADKLAHAISAFTGTDIGEHSSANSPWFSALDALNEYSTRSKPAVEEAKSTEGKKPKAWYYVRANGSSGITSGLDIAKQSAGIDGSVFGLWTKEDISVGNRQPSAFLAYHGIMTYLVLDQESGEKRYPNVVSWIPLYLEKDSYEFCMRLTGKID